ncbi:MAG: 4Fe-4S cluster-binding domain-containing protein [Planctomycetes bacterium]|nr:4Fe-4S cluster-binding domain-containing protein [Planctomycetota bacterium]HPY75940.1 4Fe-4S cluster-binding domain-containing protein [Planctomycetota bacterium]HQB00168.1 4Fe-4S cluster-binding domain-containing protein [Planctomycetota bacterium]
MSAQKKMKFLLDLNKKFNVSHINLCTEVEGPYKRLAIWFQGCNILCEECCNPELQPLKKAHIMTVQEILDITLNSRDKNGIEGVTLLGGEPTLQENLHILCHALQLNNLGVILFTGKLKNELPDYLIKNTDLIIDGKYLKNHNDTKRNLIGSTNQTIHFITERYKDKKNWFYEIREKKVEINISSNKINYLIITGDVV